MTAQIITDVLDEWRAGIDAHDPARVAAVFTEDAVFQGLRRYGVGRDTVAEYYDSQPRGMTVTYQVLESRRPAADVVFGYLRATFGFEEREGLQLFIGVVLTRTAGHWRIAQYQASRMG